MDTIERFTFLNETTAAVVGCVRFSIGMISTNPNRRRRARVKPENRNVVRPPQNG